MDDMNRSLDQVTRLEIIDANGRSYVNGAARDVSLSLQDDVARVSRWEPAQSCQSLKNARDILENVSGDDFPAIMLNKALEIADDLTDSECDAYLKSTYRGRYTKLVLLLMYPDRVWKDVAFREDHIFPKVEFSRSRLNERGYGETKVGNYLAKVDQIPNLELLTDYENLQKNATPFEVWLKTRDADFKDRHLIPDHSNYSFDAFEEFFKARSDLLKVVSRLRLMDMQAK